MTKLYHDLLSNSPQTVTIDIPADMGTGQISQVVIKQGAVVSDWKMNYFSDMNYGFIEQFIDELGKKFHIKEIAFDRWGAVQMVQNLEGMGFTVVPFGQGYKDMRPPTKELMKLTLEERIAYGGHKVLRWMMDKEKSTEKIAGVVATIMALDRAIRNEGCDVSVYDDRGILVFKIDNE